MEIAELVEAVRGLAMAAAWHEIKEVGRTAAGQPASTTLSANVTGSAPVRGHDGRTDGETSGAPTPAAFEV
jgi:hypothetical protein